MICMLMPFADLPGHYRQHASAAIAGLRRLGWRVDGIGFGRRGAPGCRWLGLRLPRALHRRYGPRGGTLRCLLMLPCAVGWVLRGGRRLHWTDGVLGVSVLLALVPVTGLRVVHQCWGELRFGRGPLARCRHRLLRCLLRRGRLRLLTEIHEDAVAAIEALGLPVAQLPYRPQWPPAPDRAQARRCLGVAVDDRVLLVFGVRRPDKDIAGIIDAWRRSAQGRRPVLVVCGAGAAAGLTPRVCADGQTALRSEAGLIVRDGYLPPHDVAEVFAACDAVVLPYPAGSRRASGVFWDAVHFRRPLVVPAGTGRNAALVSRFGCGLVYDPDRAGWLEEVCRQLADDRLLPRLEAGLVDAADAAPYRRSDRVLAFIHPRRRPGIDLGGRGERGQAAFRREVTS